MSNWNRKIIDRQKFERFSNVFLTILLVVSGLIFILARPKAVQLSSHYLIKEYFEHRDPSLRINRLISPFDLRFEPIDLSRTNVFGWVVLTNSTGLIRTQWFRAAFEGDTKQNRLEKMTIFYRDPAVYGTNRYRGEPQ
jgi:hypothetical protein